MLSFPTRSHLDPVSSTEAATLTETLPGEMNKEWEWFRFSSLIKPHFIPDGHGAYELVIEVRYHSTVYCPAIPDGFLTSSFSVHPYLPGLRPQYQNRRRRWLLNK